MATWSDVGLVLAGSTGPLAIALINALTNRRLEKERWHRQDRDQRRQLYSQFIGMANQVFADWLDYANMPPRTIEDERKLDERRDANYQQLNVLSSLVRLTAPDDVVASAEQLLQALRGTQRTAREAAAPGATGIPQERWSSHSEEFGKARKQFVAAIRTAHGILSDEYQAG